MGIFERMQAITKGKSKELEESEEVVPAKVGDILNGVITNLIYPSPGKKGGFGFIASPQLPFERIFFHWSGLRQDTLRFPKLEKKMKVEFLLQYSEPSDIHEGGFRAVKIKVL